MQTSFALQTTAAVLGFLSILYALTGGYKLVNEYLFTHGKETSCTPGIGSGNCQWISALSVLAVFVGFYLGYNDPFITISVPILGVLALSAYVDLAVHKLPNRLTFLALVIFLLGLGLRLIILPFENPLPFIASAVFGALVWGLPPALIYYLMKGIGFGDVKLAPVLGAWLGLYGFETAYVGLTVAFLIGGAVALYLVTVKKQAMKTRIAFGPFLILGACLVWALTV
ncbi:peptidase, A24 family [Gleimia coleocanis DSM 15436]|uniref:Peptidase, A24 family n=1 Tax=Gleimia coleocanis DSM 15436 TaxID=525245 RepID=C0W1M8_9ACTO|nr:A24 family peptidase [Gleimia coleocanis]EEH63394.1 peptidase, A24 family [Gleimia coleocanis DSM 15436]